MRGKHPNAGKGGRFAHGCENIPLIDGFVAPEGEASSKGRNNARAEVSARALLLLFLFVCTENDCNWRNPSV